MGVSNKDSSLAEPQECSLLFLLNREETREDENDGKVRRTKRNKQLARIRATVRMKALPCLSMKEIGGRMGDEKQRESQDGSFFP